MTTYELDLSKSDSLIDDIQKIFKPPSVEPSTTTRLSKNSSKSNGNVSQDTNSKELSCVNLKVADELDNRHKSWKKPKLNSHEYCDSCSTYDGERLVCDRCPASFHLVCLDPPIDVEDAPVGVWYCNRCTAIMKDEDDKLSNASGNSNSKVDTEGSNYQSNGLCPSMNKRSGSSVSSEITTEMSEEIPTKKMKYSHIPDGNFRNLNALQNVIEVVQCLNPKEFELPRHMIPVIKLPSSFKNPIEMKNKSVVTLENGTVPKPIVTCYECSRTCFYGTLVQCDYCPFYYHLDCLDPPLIQLPSRVERWMCPNHLEQVVDEVGMIKTLRLSERIKTYEQIKLEMKTINEMELVSAFASGRGYRFGNYFKLDNVNNKIKVPDAVKRMYKSPIKNAVLKSRNSGFKMTEDQSSILKQLFKASQNNADWDLSEKEPQELLELAVDSIKLLITERKINLNTEISMKPCVQTKPSVDKIKSRAVLIPLIKNEKSKNLDPIRIIYRNFTIGSGRDSDCIISGCKYVSAHHASICYIDNHYCFELINYSRYGTVVDELLYYNDVSQKDAHRFVHTNQNVKDIRNFLGLNGRQRNRKHSMTNKCSAMASQRDMDKDISSCTCLDYGYCKNVLNNCQEQGWESNAPLRFGSVIGIGCQKFLFTSVSDSSKTPSTTSLSETVTASSTATDVNISQNSDNSKDDNDNDNKIKEASRHRHQQLPQSIQESVSLSIQSNFSKPNIISGTATAVAISASNIVTTTAASNTVTRTSAEERDHFCSRQDKIDNINNFDEDNDDENTSP